MKKEKLDNINLSEIVLDERLEQYNDRNLFPKQLAKAQEIIAKYGLPKTKKLNEKIL